MTVPIPRDHQPIYGLMQRMVRAGALPDAVRQAYLRGVEALRSAEPAEMRLRSGTVDLSSLPANRRLEAATVAGLEARDPDAIVHAIFGRPLDENVMKALRAGRIAEALERIEETNRFAASLAGLERPLQTMAARTAAVAVEELPRVAKGISRVAVELRANAWASRHAGDLITNVTRESQLAVRELAEQAILEERDVRRAARSIREVVGLNRQQAAAFDKFIQQAMDSDAHKSAAGVQQAIDREFARLVKRRADTLARTELWTAGQEGQREAWKEAADEGALDIRGLDDVFRSDLGEELDGPLAHPGCFCSVRLRSIERNGVRFYVREWVVSVRNPCERCLAFKGKLAYRS